MVDKQTHERPPAWLWVTGLAGLVLTCVWYFALRVAHGGSSMPMGEHGALGSSFGPVSALFSLAALLAALWSMELQRRALRGQDMRLDEQQKILAAHRDQFVRSADAHNRLADAQVRANEQAIRMEHAFRSGTVATLNVALLGSYVEARTFQGDKLLELIKKLEENVEAEESIVAERGNLIFEDANARLAKEGTRLG
jgi:hypothetical protein